MSGIWQQNFKKLTDAHCHLLDYPNPAILERIKADKLDVFLVTTRPDQFDLAYEIQQDKPSIRAGLGLFPLYLDKDPSEQLELFEDRLQKTRFIGEVGLDFSVEKELQKTQIKVFEKILELAETKENCVFSLHSRRSAETLFEMIKGVDARFIMHWFSGAPELLNELPDNIYFSINPVMLRSRSGKNLVRQIPSSQILLESDGPYIKFKEEDCNPYQLTSVVESLAAVRNSDPISIVSEIHERFNKIFSF